MARVGDSRQPETRASRRLAPAGGVDFTGASLEREFFGGANLEGASFAKANLEGAILVLLRPRIYAGPLLTWANLTERNLTRVNLNGASVGDGWLEQLEEWKVIGREEIKAKYFIDENGVLREKR